MLIKLIRRRKYQINKFILVNKLEYTMSRDAVSFLMFKPLICFFMKIILE